MNISRGELFILIYLVLPKLNSKKDTGEIQNTVGDSRCSSEGGLDKEERKVT